MQILNISYISYDMFNTSDLLFSFCVVSGGGGEGVDVSIYNVTYFVQGARYHILIWVRTFSCICTFLPSAIYMWAGCCTFSRRRCLSLRSLFLLPPTPPLSCLPSAAGPRRARAARDTAAHADSGCEWSDAIWFELHSWRYLQPALLDLFRPIGVQQ